MKVVIDTNVVVSGALRDRLPEEVILFVCAHPEFDWIATPEIIAEYLAVLRRDKFRLPADLIQQWADLFDQMITAVEAQGTVDFPRDQKDAMFIACALSSDADYFITGDKDFGEARRIGVTTVLSASQFKRLIMDTW